MSANTANASDDHDAGGGFGFVSDVDSMLEAGDVDAAAVRGEQGLADALPDCPEWPKEVTGDGKHTPPLATPCAPQHQCRVWQLRERARTR